jgi:hypothetical protein
LLISNPSKLQVSPLQTPNKTFRNMPDVLPNHNIIKFPIHLLRKIQPRTPKPSKIPNNPSLDLPHTSIRLSLLRLCFIQLPLPPHQPLLTIRPKKYYPQKTNLQTFPFFKNFSPPFPPPKSSNTPHRPTSPPTLTALSLNPSIQSGLL